MAINVWILMNSNDRYDQCVLLFVLVIILLLLLLDNELLCVNDESYY